MATTRFVNLTTHPVSVWQDGKVIKTYPAPKGPPARVKTTEQIVRYVDDVPCRRTARVRVENLPPEQEGVYYIVSLIVLELMRGFRNDLVTPDRKNCVRDDEGRVMAVRGFKC